MHLPFQALCVCICISSKAFLPVIYYLQYNTAASGLTDIIIIHRTLEHTTPEREGESVCVCFRESCVIIFM